MNIPGLDFAVSRAVSFLFHAGRIRTVKHLRDVDLARVSRVLIVITTALGDSITFTPALTALREKFRTARLVGLYHAAFADLYRVDPRLDRVISYHGKYRRLGETLRALREESCELVLLPYMNDPDVIPLVLAAGARILFRMPGRNTIYSYLVAEQHLLSAVPPPGHANERATDMVKLLGCDIRQSETSLHVSPESPELISRLLAGLPIPKGGFGPVPPVYIGFHPGASIEQKRWPTAQYRRLAVELLREFPRSVILATGSARERVLCGEICSESPSRMFNLAGSVAIEDMPDLLRRLAVLVSGDTGIAVMAYAVGCRTVTLFWHTDPSRSGPYHEGDRHRVIRSLSGDAPPAASPVMEETVRQVRTSLASDDSRLVHGDR